MTNRALDWFRQSERDLAQAEDSKSAQRHEWACFAAQQAAEKAMKALHLSGPVRKPDLPFERRGAQWDTTDLPVPTDILIYTSLEFKKISKKGRFGQMLMKELIWIDSNSQ